jgi:hypothetical protein
MDTLWSAIYNSLHLPYRYFEAISTADVFPLYWLFPALFIGGTNRHESVIKHQIHDVCVGVTFPLCYALESYLVVTTIPVDSSLQ